MWTGFWGSEFHSVLKKVAVEYPDNPTHEQQTNAKNLVMSLFSLLCCKHCRAHARYYLQIHPLTAHSRNAFLDWLVTFHNRLNQRLGKRCNWTVQEALEALRDDMNMQKEGLDRAQRMRKEDDKKIRALYAHIAVLEKKLLEKDCRDFVIQVDGHKASNETIDTDQDGKQDVRAQEREYKDHRDTPMNQKERAMQDIKEELSHHVCLGEFGMELNKETETFTLCVLGFVALLLFVAFGLLLCKI
jgi:hypothetical protein